MHNMVTSMGFWGILICASVPNPLFDLAGIMCGHFGVEFSTFFGATFFGKALFKCNIQAMSVIVFFSKETLIFIQTKISESLPWLRNVLSGIFSSLQTFGDNNAPISVKENTNIISYVWNLFMMGMIFYFIISTVESLALSHMKQKRHQPSAKAKAE
ncbi:hypothetical protein HDV03_005409 [Kappamyces sp. JEL0829]|nr:hypothetical protein HDV03_005409 [Kappamyces sp. JEL0829]